jgi:ATP-dependent DNA helicase RecG
MSTTIEDINKWLGVLREDEHIEFKEARNQFPSEKVMCYSVALANEGGGKLILGVTNIIPRKVVGTKAFENIENIQSKIFQTLGFRVDVEEVNHTDGRVVIFHIPPRPMGSACSYEGKHFMRIGEELHVMSTDQLRKIFDEGKPDWCSEIALADISDEDVYNLLDIPIYFRLTKQTLPLGDNALERFEKERLLVKTKEENYSITNLGAILFAKNLKSFPTLERKAIRLIVYEGKDKTAPTKLDVTGEKGYAVGFEPLIIYMGSFLPKNQVIGRALRDTVPMYPDIAIRELVANSIIHQDYTETGTSVVIEIYADRIEISNPGVPFIAPEHFIDEFQSRNERLAAIMRRLRICEELGKGIDRVVASVEVYQLPAPDFRVGTRRTTVVLFGHKTLSEMDNDDKIRACYQHCVLKWVMEQKMTNRSLRERFKLSTSKTDFISRIIQHTLEAKLIKAADPENTSKRYTRYIPFWA